MKTFTLLTILSCIPLLHACSDVGSSETAAELAAVKSRLAALEAESEIGHKLQTYMKVLGESDWDTYVTYFTRDAKLIMTEGTRVGRDDIKERMSSAGARLAAAAAAAPDPTRPPRRRADLLSSVEIDVSGNTATAKSRFVFIGENANSGFDVTGSGLYIDEWALEDGEWLIASRTVDYDLLRGAPPAAAPKAE